MGDREALARPGLGTGKPQRGLGQGQESPERLGWGIGKRGLGWGQGIPSEAQVGDREAPERPGLRTIVFPCTLSYCLTFFLGCKLGAVFLVETTFQFVAAFCSYAGKQVCDIRMMATGGLLLFPSWCWADIR